jgi:hypothetical protein
VTDTPPEVARRYRKLLLARSGADRLRMGGSMHAAARALVRASVLARDPGASPATIRRALFLRFYGDDFDPATRERVLAWLDRSHRA